MKEICQVNVKQLVVVKLLEIRMSKSCVFKYVSTVIKTLKTLNAQKLNCLLDVCLGLFCLLIGFEVSF